MTLSQTNPHHLHPSDDDDSGPIIRIDASRRLEAVQRLVGAGPPPAVSDPDHARRFLDYAQSNGICLDHLFSRMAGDAPGSPIHQTVLAVPSPGRTAMLFSSGILSETEIGPLSALIAATCRSFISHGKNTQSEVCLAQTLLDLDDESGRLAFSGADFQDLASLSYLERPVPTRRSAPQPQWPQDTTIHSYAPNRHDELMQILDDSYENTLDCPGLCGLRSTHDILEGHRGTGTFTPHLWTILKVEGKPAGAILLNPTANGKTIELVYMGLCPRVRGQGLGRQLLRHGLSLLAGRAERTVTLAVDENNTPALSMYQREGFRRMLRRRALIFPIPTA